MRSASRKLRGRLEGARANVVRFARGAPGSFRLSVQLPEGVDAGKVTAEHADGILTVRVAKSTAAAAKRIPVSAK